MWLLHMTSRYICIYVKPKFFITFHQEQTMLQEDGSHLSCGLSFSLEAGFILSTLDNLNLQVIA